MKTKWTRNVEANKKMPKRSTHGKAEAVETIDTSSKPKKEARGKSVPKHTVKSIKKSAK